MFFYAVFFASVVLLTATPTTSPERMLDLSAACVSFSQDVPLKAQVARRPLLRALTPSISKNAKIKRVIATITTKPDS